MVAALKSLIISFLIISALPMDAYASSTPMTIQTIITLTDKATDQFTSNLTLASIHK